MKENHQPTRKTHQPGGLLTNKGIPRFMQNHQEFLLNHVFFCKLDKLDAMVRPEVLWMCFFAVKKTVLDFQMSRGQVVSNEEVDQVGHTIDATDDPLIKGFSVARFLVNLDLDIAVDVTFKKKRRFSANSAMKL